MKTRWTTYDAKYFGEELPKDVLSSIQERAYFTDLVYAGEMKGSKSERVKESKGQKVKDVGHLDLLTIRLLDFRLIVTAEKSNL